MRSKIHRWVGVFVVVASMGTAGCGGCNEGPTRAPSAETPKKGKAPRKGKAPAKRRHVGDISFIWPPQSAVLLIWCLRGTA